MTVGSLFAGIGGFDLGFERAGFEIRWQVEIDDYASRVLAKHWPGVRRYGDIRAIDWSTVEPVDVVCGGFPCQPHSVAGTRRASKDERDLWPEYARCVRAVKPGWVVAENVPGLLSSDDGRFLGTILGDLASIGYDAEWDCVSASDIGAAQSRDRVWVVAYRQGRHGFTDSTVFGRQEPSRVGDWWTSEPGVVRVADGVPDRTHRLRGLGNSVVPQIVEWIAHRIKEADAMVMRDAVASGHNRGSAAQ